MRKPIIPSVVKTLREREGLSQKALAEKAGISKDSLSRLERGTQTGTAERTQAALAKAFTVVPEVLTGEQEIPPAKGEAAQPKWDAPRDQWNLRVDSAVRNAFALTAIRYQIPVGRIVELAPLLFVLAAEDSLERRRGRLAKLEEGLASVTEAAAGFYHLPKTIDPGFEADDAIIAEQGSIEARDILADKLDNDLYRRFGPQKRDYDPDQDNPFVCDLKAVIERLSRTNAGIAAIAGLSRDYANFQVCGREALELAGGDRELAKGILFGWAPIHEMRELLGDDSLDDRIAWLRQKKIEYEATMAQMLIDLGLDLPMEGPGS